MVVQKYDSEIAKAMGSEAVRMTEGAESENRRLRARIKELEEIIGGKRGEICESCGIDIDTVTERLMQAQERNNDLSLELMERGNQDEKAWQTVTKLRVDLETTDRLRIQVSELQEASRKLCNTPPGDWELTCNGDAFHELYALLPNNTKDTPKC